MKHGGDYRSLEPTDDVFTVDLKRALELFAQPKRGRGQAQRTVLKDFGKHPDTEEAVQLLDGRYGPYLTDGELNANLPKGADVEKMTLDDAIVVLRETGKPPKRKAKKKAGAKKKTTKKKAAKKKTTKKKATKKTAAAKKTTKKKAAASGDDE